MNTPKVNCDNYDCKYWNGGEECTKETIMIMGPGPYPTCESYEPYDESEEQA